MRMLHDPAVRQSLEGRLMALRPDASRKWGSMSPDQMLWHLNQFLSFSLGEGRHKQGKSPMPLPVLRFFLLYMPWPKSAPTHPGAKAKEAHDFDAERERFLVLVERFVSKPLDEPWPVDAAFGNVSGTFSSKLQAKHIDYHFRQFNG
jgi:hypothetical protein